MEFVGPRGKSCFDEVFESGPSRSLLKGEGIPPISGLSFQDSGDPRESFVVWYFVSGELDVDVT